jgi:alkylresorcinol/alkylpyrone synthase
MFIQGIGTATPPYRYSQRECWDAFTRSPYLEQLSSRSQAILRKVLSSDNGIETRHFAMSELSQAFSLDPNTLHRRFADNAPALAAEAARKAMEHAEAGSAEIDALIISTCTGYVCPGLTSYVSEKLGLKSGAALADLVGHGCGAALPNLQLANSLITARHAKRVLSICVEICSAAFYVDNDPGVLVSACLFADAAGAVILGDRPGKQIPSVEWTRYRTLLNPRDRDLLRFETRNGMLRNILDKSVPVVVVEHVREVLREILREGNKSKTDIAEWILHSGGRDVLAALQSGSGLGIPAEKLRWSAEVLRENGNISSPSVIFALEKALRNDSDGTWFLSAFGAGISCHGALLEVRH